MGELGEHPRDLHTFPYWVKTLKGNQSETIDNSISRNGFPGCFISVCSSCFQLAAVCLVQLTVLIRLENNLVSWESGDSFAERPRLPRQLGGQDSGAHGATPHRSVRHHTGRSKSGTGDTCATGRGRGWRKNPQRRRIQSRNDRTFVSHRSFNLHYHHTPKADTGNSEC